MHIAQVRLGRLLVDPGPLASTHHPCPFHWYASLLQEHFHLNDPPPFHWYASLYFNKIFTWMTHLPLLFQWKFDWYASQLQEHFHLNHLPPLFHSIPPLVCSSSRVPSMADQVGPHLWSTFYILLERLLICPHGPCHSVMKQKIKISGKEEKRRQELFCSGCEVPSMTLSQRWTFLLHKTQRFLLWHWSREPFYHIKPEHWTFLLHKTRGEKLALRTFL